MNEVSLPAVLLPIASAVTLIAGRPAQLSGRTQTLGRAFSFVHESSAKSRTSRVRPPSWAMRPPVPSTSHPWVSVLCARGKELTSSSLQAALARLGSEDGEMNLTRGASVSAPAQAASVHGLTSNGAGPPQASFKSSAPTRHALWMRSSPSASRVRRSFGERDVARTAAITPD